MAVGSAPTWRVKISLLQQVRGCKTQCPGASTCYHHCKHLGVETGKEGFRISGAGYDAYDVSRSQPQCTTDDDCGPYKS